KTTQSIIIDNAGIGYEIFVPLSNFYALPEKNEEVSLHIYTHVKEDALMLFGFQTPLEKDIFMLLISVSGIGPKLAINILSGIGPDDLLGAMARKDAVRLQSIPGVGKKTAERLALELGEKAQLMMGDMKPALPQAVIDVDKKVLDDAVSALLNLGYSTKLSKNAVEKAHSGAKDMSLASLIKEALRVLA
ncbi:MAG: Holliday junction branch migration protein RuvA, partial [Deltaproteobacteria bacterium]